MRPFPLAAFALAASLGAATLFAMPAAMAEDLNKPIAAPVLDAPKTTKATTEKAVLAGGCFWGQQGVFQRVKGVKKVVSGYSGGTRATATYDLVSSEKTNHAEVIEITFDPRVVSYGDLLKIYFSVAHDPTQLNRQGPDHGPSYRSEIFAANPMQQKIAEAYIAQLSQAKIFSGPIVTKVSSLKAFYPAEGYHQDFLLRNPKHGYIVTNDLPKIEGLKSVWPQHVADKPVTLKAAGFY